MSFVEGMTTMLTKRVGARSSPHYPFIPVVKPHCMDLFDDLKQNLSLKFGWPFCNERMIWLSWNMPDNKDTACSCHRMIMYMSSLCCTNSPGFISTGRVPSRHINTINSWKQSPDMTAV